MRTELEKLIENLTTPTAEVDFQEVLLKGVKILDLSDEHLARRFGASRPTITRWRNGSHAPHPAMRAVVYGWILEQAKSRLSRLKRAEEQEAEMEETKRKRQERSVRPSSPMAIHGKARE